LKYLADSSVWIDYWKGGKNSVDLDYLIDENLIVINDIILAELTPVLHIQNHQKTIKILNAFEKIELDIDWNEIIKIQTKCLKNGFNGIGIPDLIIAQNCIQNKVRLWSFDKHFVQVSEIVKLNLKK
jgi:predicted nucleic acid-binding protein